MNDISANSSRQWHFLIVEDEPMIALMLDEMLVDLGHDVVGRVASLAEGLAALDLGFDAAIVDINLAGEVSWPLIDAIRARECPVLLSTGAPDLDSRGLPVLAKPFLLSHLRAGIERLNNQ